MNQNKSKNEVDDILREIASDIRTSIANEKDRFIGSLRLISIDSEDVIKILICTGLLLLFLMLQTTFFSGLAPFGATPDIMIIFIVAVSMSEGEVWGAVWGLVSAYLIEALGTTGVTLLPLLYFPCGLVCGALSRYYLSGNIAVRALFTVSASAASSIFALIYSFIEANGITFIEAITDLALPQFLSTLVISPIVHLLVWLSLKSFHKTRAERTNSYLR